MTSPAVPLRRRAGRSKGAECDKPIAGAAGIPAYGGTMYEGGIALAAGIHFAAATPNLTLGAEFYTAAFVLGVELLERPIRLENGASHLPAGPGLGVEIDREALDRLTVQSAS